MCITGTIIAFSVKSPVEAQLVQGILANFDKFGLDRNLFAHHFAFCMALFGQNIFNGEHIFEGLSDKKAFKLRAVHGGCTFWKINSSKKSRHINRCSESDVLSGNQLIPNGFRHLIRAEVDVVG